MIGKTYLSLFLICGIANAVPRLNTPKVEKTSIQRANEDCSARVGEVQDYRDLVQKVAIRGKDDRVVSDDFSGTVRLGCDSNGKAKGLGSANLVGDKKIVTVLHNVVNTDTCEPLYDYSKCFIVNDNKRAKIKNWKSDPSELCRSIKEKQKNSISKQGDGIIVAELEDKIEGRESYSVLCGEDIETHLPTSMHLAAKSSKNFKAKIGEKQAIKSEGEICNLNFKSGEITYTHDSGDQSSGGGLFADIKGKKYMFGINYGDAKATKDGTAANCKNNFGIGYMLESDALKDECEKAKKDLSQNGTGS